MSQGYRNGILRSSDKSGPELNWGRGTRFFVGSRQQFTPSPPEARRRKGWGEEAVPMSFPLSLTLSPFVPHGERGLAGRAVSNRLLLIRLLQPDTRCRRPFPTLTPTHWGLLNQPDKQESASVVSQK